MENLSDLKYGYYKEYCSGDGSMYDHCTSYVKAPKHYTVFAEDSNNYYDILDDRKPYKKDAEYGETLVTIECELSDILPSFIDSNREYTLDEILLLMPKKVITKLSQKKQKTMKL